MTKTPEEIARDIAEDATLVGYFELREWLCDAIVAAIQAERDEATKLRMMLADAHGLLTDWQDCIAAMRDHHDETEELFAKHRALAQEQNDAD